MGPWFNEFAQRYLTSDFYVGLPFWGYLAVAVLVFRAFPVNGIPKAMLLLACNVLMLLTMPRFNVTMLAVLFGMCVATYIAGTTLSAGTRLVNVRTRRLVAAGGIMGILCVLAFFKYAFVQDAILGRTDSERVKAEHFIFLIGISYSSFKAIHFIIESYKKNITQNSFLIFLNYMFFFPSFISGPINRYNHFYEHSFAARKSRFRDDIMPGLGRIVDGLFKKIVLVAIVFPYTLKNLGVPVEQMAPWQVVVGLYALALYFYFDFSGYTDLAIGTARIMGFVLPENFDYPFLKRNIQQLWAHWHMSLTTWLTEYIYWPLVRRMRTGDFMRKHPVFLSNIAILVTFLICGIWHGETLNFAVWGLYQGIGIATVNTYQQWKRKVRNASARKYFTSGWSYGFGIFATFNFFALGQSLFVLDAKQMRILLERLTGM